MIFSTSSQFMKSHFILITFLSLLSLCRADLTKGWFYTDAFPYMWSNNSQSWQYLLLSENKLWLYDYGDSEWSLLQSGQHIGTSDFEKGYAAKIKEIHDSPTNYGLFSQTHMETERAISYNEGYQAGIDSLTPEPIASGNAPLTLSNKEILGISSLGQISKFVFNSNGQTGTVTDASGSSSFDYFYEKTEPNAATFNINTNSEIVRGEVEFTSTSTGTFTLVHRSFATREITATHSGTFTME